MPFLNVTVDGAAVATVCTDGRDILNVRVGGSRDDEDFADLSVTGGVYDRNGTTEHRTWVDQMRLAAGQVIGVELLTDATSRGEGKAIEELYPDSPEFHWPSPSDRAELTAEIRELPLVRDGFTLRLVGSDGISITHRTAPDEHGFGFSVLWNRQHPDRISMLLSCYTIDSVAAETLGRILSSQKVALPGWVHLELVA